MTTNVKCIICGKALSRCLDGPSVAPEIDAWSGGGAHQFIPGYGSKHDTVVFVLALCDNCIDSKLRAGLLIEQEICQVCNKSHKEALGE